MEGKKTYSWLVAAACKQDYRWWWWRVSQSMKKNTGRALTSEELQICNQRTVFCFISGWNGWYVCHDNYINTLELSQCKPCSFHSLRYTQLLAMWPVLKDKNKFTARIMTRKHLHYPHVTWTRRWLICGMKSEMGHTAQVMECSSATLLQWERAHMPKKKGAACAKVTFE